MLSNPEMFATVETVCRERGTIENFEVENGEKIKGRMMIDDVNMPDDVSLYPNINERIFAFEASFDFMDTRIGLALCIFPIKAASEIWFYGSRDGSKPDNVWVEFFVKTLVESIKPDGSHGVPIYTFISDHASFSVIPSASDEF